MRYIQSGSGIESFLPKEILYLFLCGFPRLRNFCPSSCTAQAPRREQGHLGGCTREEKRPQRFPGLVMRYPRILFAPPGHGLATTGCSSEAIDMTASSWNRERGRQQVYENFLLITPGTPIWLPQLDFLTNPCSSAAVVQAGVSMRRHNTPPRKLAGMPASSQCSTSPVTGCTKTAPPSPGPGSGTLDTQPEESVATRASKSRKTTVMALPAERDPGLSMFMLRLLAGQGNDRAPPAERSRIRMPSASTRWLVVTGTAGLCSDPFPTGVTCSAQF